MPPDDYSSPPASPGSEDQDLSAEHSAGNALGARGALGRPAASDEAAALPGGADSTQPARALEPEDVAVSSPAGELDAPGSHAAHGDTPSHSDWQPLADGWIPAEIIAYRILNAVLGLSGGVVVALQGTFGWTRAALGLGVALAMSVVLEWGARVLVRAQFRRCRWSLDEEHFRMRKGIWWRKEIHVPRSRLQHTDVTQGPLQRLYGVATLVLHTAGTHYSTVSVEGLDHDEAREIRDRLLVGGADDGL